MSDEWELGELRRDKRDLVAEVERLQKEVRVQRQVILVLEDRIEHLASEDKANG